MKTTLILCLTVPLALGLSGCRKPDSSETAQTNAGGVGPINEASSQLERAAKSTGTALAQGRDAFVASAETSLKQLDAEIDRLAAKTSSLAGDAKAKGEEMLASLRQKRLETNAQLDKIKAASQETWADVKTGFDNSMLELKKAFDDVKTRLQ